VAEIVAPTGDVVDGVIEADTLFRMLDGGLTPTGLLPARVERFAGAGLDPAMLLQRGEARAHVPTHAAPAASRGAAPGPAAAAVLEGPAA
jgi:pilus assembly protein CpaF